MLLDTLKEQIVNASKTEDTETEIVRTDEYTTNLVAKLRHFRIFKDKISQPIFPIKHYIHLMKFLM